MLCDGLDAWNRTIESHWYNGTAALYNEQVAYHPGQPLGERLQCQPQRNHHPSHGGQGWRGRIKLHRLGRDT